MICKICGNAKNNTIYEVKEMMFGYGDKFIYFQCSKCECLQISEIPLDMSRYYPHDYYSLSLDSSNPLTKILRKTIIKVRDRYAVFNKGIIGKILYRRFPHETLRSLSRIRLAKNSRILDVGCGVGTTLLQLKELGFNNLMGIDPYIKKDIEYNGLKILKKTIHEINGIWDLIMFHHSFEHIPDPSEVLGCVLRLLSSGGCCLIRMPTISSYAWEHYRENWAQIDAPRHLFLYSIASIDILRKKANMRLEKRVDDSSEFQFWGSEQYKKGISLTSDKSYGKNPSNSIFSRAEIRYFRKKALEVNFKNRGDQASFYLIKA